MKNFMDFIEKAEGLNIYQKNQLKRLVKTHVEDEKLAGELKKLRDREVIYRVVFRGRGYVVVQETPAPEFEEIKYPFTPFIRVESTWVRVGQYYEYIEEAIFAALAWISEGSNYYSDKCVKKLLNFNI